MAQRVGRGIALLFHDRGTRSGWVVSSTPRPHFNPRGKIRYPFYRRLDGPQGRSGRPENLVPTGIRSRTVQPVLGRYTDWATGPTNYPYIVTYFVQQCMHKNFLLVSPLRLLTDGRRKDSSKWEALIVEAAGSSPAENCLWKRPLYELIVRQIQSENTTLTLIPLTPNDDYSGRTAPLTSKRCILYIYSTNTGTEYFKHGIYCPFFSLQNAVCFIILTYLVPVLLTFYMQVC